MTSLNVLPEAEAFFLKRGKVGCLLCHGYTGTPKEVRALGEYLAELGVTVYAPRLPGHGSSIANLQGTSFNIWYEEYLRGVEKLTAICTEVFISGLSLGGLLSLKYAIDHRQQPLAGIIVMATPLSFGLVNNVALTILSKIAKNLSVKKSKQALRQMKVYNILCYDRDPIGPANSIRKALRVLKRQLEEIHHPILILQGLQDARWVVSSAKKILQGVSSHDKKVVYFSRSAHNLLMGPDKKALNLIVYHFIKQHSTLL